MLQVNKISFCSLKILRIKDMRGVEHIVEIISNVVIKRHACPTYFSRRTRNESRGISTSFPSLFRAARQFPWIITSFDPPSEIIRSRRLLAAWRDKCLPYTFGPPLVHPLVTSPCDSKRFADGAQQGSWNALVRGWQGRWYDVNSRCTESG